ncbi:MAG: 4-(cytidine 5'-diphospho)-2-C-methyl-D-erythritol kinase [Flavobacteriales bacterium]|nr:4-(cytidine 5'-diphospho)-2-C-methyl-D-erythritol kinase [Flavobacteriales bacterium]
MIGFANAKINIGLFITEKRDDGFHNLETIFYPIAFHDVLEFAPASDERTLLRIHGITIPGASQENLIIKAYNKLSEEHKLPKLQISLIKNIPTGAGLGGGSSDGAKMLLMLNDYFKLNLSTQKLIEYASVLGSDCPFFIHNKPCFASGRGEILHPQNLNLSDYLLILVHPGIHVSTKEAFAHIKPMPADIDLKSIEQIDIHSWKEIIRNDFELPLFSKFSELGDIKRKLYKEGAVFASMSGSGSAIFGLFPRDCPPKDFGFPKKYLFKQIPL